MSSNPLHPSSSGAGGREPAIAAVGVGKCYQIYEKPRDRLKQALLGRFKRFYRPFWALHDVSFEVQPGEAVGIVGRNGSGKSTLLQMIAGTLTPTEGEIRVRGRVAALLELGSGFNPEFTGRENVFLQGAILGISRREMERRFDEIAAFADIGDFIDQPIKHYSSGMHARLAFSVAVSVDPEILIVDEVLAVGDMGFQQKCIARMRQLLDRGVTLLFVSHVPDSIKSLCQKGLFLAGGRQQFFGSAEEAVDRYHNSIRDAVNEEAQRQEAGVIAPIPFENALAGSIRYGTGQAQIHAVRLLDSRGRITETFNFGEEIVLEVIVRAMRPTSNLDVHFHVRDSVGVDLFGTGTADEGVRFPELPAGSLTATRFRFRNNLRVGSYGVSVTLTKLPDRLGVGGITLDHVSGVAPFGVVADLQRPVMYKFHQPVSVEWESDALAAGAAAAPNVEVSVDGPGLAAPASVQ